MRILISPAKKMREDDSLPPRGTPCFPGETEQILSCLRALSPAGLKALWRCSEPIAEKSLEELRRMDLRRGTPALLAYDGIQYQYMEPSLFDSAMLDWAQEHLRILSGFYGVLRPLDAVMPYRLEMQAKLCPAGAKGLYAFWGSLLYREVLPEDRVLLNLASDEYSRAVSPFLQPGDRFITCIFGERENGKTVQKGVYAKMARGEMVRYLAGLRAEDPEQAQGFDRLDYVFHPELSGEDRFVFLREPRRENLRPEFEWE